MKPYKELHAKAEKQDRIFANKIDEWFGYTGPKYTYREPASTLYATTIAQKFLSDYENPDDWPWGDQTPSWTVLCALAVGATKEELLNIARLLA